MTHLTGSTVLRVLQFSSLTDMQMSLPKVLTLGMKYFTGYLNLAHESSKTNNLLHEGMGNKFVISILLLFKS